MATIQQFKHIQAFIFDMDGVLTDGKLYIGPEQDIQRTSHMRDGYALHQAVEKGYTIIIISGAHSESYYQRLYRLGVRHIYMGVKDKLAQLDSLVAQSIVDKSQVLYMGDDVPDKPAMQACLLSSCPADACDDIKMVAQYISPFKGGEGCVRDVIEKVLRVRGDWD